jgi:hypothetical protein
MNSLERSQWWSYTTQLLSQVLKSKAMMHPNPWCRINPCYLWNATLQSYNRHAIVGSFLDISNMMYCWDVNGGWPFVLYKTSYIHYLGVGKALLTYVGQRTTSNLSSRGPYFNSWTSEVDSIWPVWFLFVSKQHVGFAFLRAKHFLTFHVKHVSAKFDGSGHLRNSVLEHLEIFKAFVWTLDNP